MVYLYFIELASTQAAIIRTILNKFNIIIKDSIMVFKLHASFVLNIDRLIELK